MTLSNKYYDKRSQDFLARLAKGKVKGIAKYQASMLTEVNAWLAEIKQLPATHSDWYARTLAQTKQLQARWQALEDFIQQSCLAKRTDLSSSQQAGVMGAVQVVIMKSSPDGGLLGPVAFQLQRIQLALNCINDPVSRAQVFAKLPRFKKILVTHGPRHWGELFNSCRSQSEFLSLWQFIDPAHQSFRTQIIDEVLGAPGQPWLPPLLFDLLTSPHVDIPRLQSLFRDATHDELAVLLPRVNAFRQQASQYDADIRNSVLENTSLPEVGREQEFRELLAKHHFHLGVEDKDGNGNTPLLRAIEEEDWLQATKWLRLGARTDNCNNFGCTAHQWLGVCDKFKLDYGRSHVYGRDEDQSYQRFLQCLKKAELNDRVTKVPPSRSSKSKPLPRL